MLKIENLHKSYGKTKAVDGISFELNQGEVLGLLGPNGAGKSTTIAMISTLLKPDQGRILFNGEDIQKSSKALKNNLGYVPQEIALYPTLTGMDNLVFWGRANQVNKKDLHKRIENVANIIGIKDRLKDKVETYSGGMKRRLNIGCAMLHNPSLMIFDEPTVGIDPQSRRHILDSIKDISDNGTTIIYTSHYMEEVEFLCSKILIIDRGKIIAGGTKDELVALTKIEKQVHLEITGNIENIADSINKLASVDSVTFSDNLIKVSMISNSTSYIEILTVVTDHDGKLLSMDIKEPDLEAVFLSLTGRELRD
jgi:ABC-2 type transport system ATP-binding protein